MNIFQKLIQNPTVKRYILSSISTFSAMFFLSLSLQLTNGSGIQLTGAFLLSLLSVAIRAGAKAVVESFAGQHADVPQA